ncbi:hypothetical protein [Azospira restricta]|uniref:Uncharacterized protein n=1 Tax=Azospira restricta TaxID=404405 RepID=A0A974Y4S8_9RHOO|nr:hypothetical protein [Azospira restricta]QRJ64686.1 hypothetical protein IWH25_04870 [Azospira restricta]
MRHGNEPRGGRPLSEEEQAERLQKLMADLETSIANFDATLAEAGTGVEPAPTHTRFVPLGDYPEIDPNARREVTPTTPRAAPEAPAPAGATPLLRELAASAAGQAGHALSEAEVRRNAAFAIGHALQRLADYLQQLTTQLNGLQPETPIAFVVDGGRRFSGVRWHEGYVRHATRSLSERSLIEKLTLRVAYAAAPLSFVVPEGALPRLENAFYLDNLAWRDLGAGEPAAGGGRRIEVDGTIPVQLAFTADVERRRLLLRCRNLGGLGLAAYAIAPEAVDAELMDGLGRCLLGQVPRPPASCQPIPFNTPDGTA